MNRKRFGEDQIIAILKETRVGAKSPSISHDSVEPHSEGDSSNASLIVRNASSHSWQSTRK